jgi:hypothetical protein
MTVSDSGSVDPKCRLAHRLVSACDMFDVGVQLRIQHLRRAFPDASATEIGRRLDAWLRAAPEETGRTGLARSTRLG